ncbi:MAG: 50S ribosomal protein L31 [Candidatus Buchananbacteria bacterium CG10_big_fil_rev_8_21_14_0_10_42_9]|uniref:Large ribosomal subunit protein bL31 n=1 Tax=Candidatus Buchananbacteria bacterium CG10_big_fil_rev_8_21_14_0_10_42_9 TaxID=1974526 RepID=A0A2H0W2J5_9BACT|nr:MAG: 50S ribosomal protein L31 [Candidatus Buchananbacteria bacterium CG10_big_fil_rev_8_21_14_0_10_42_9]
MKKGIHPTYHSDAKIICSCGNVIEVGSTLKEMHVEICSNCHPFYTGKQKIIDTARRVEKFSARQSKKTSAKTISKRAKRKAKDVAKAKRGSRVKKEKAPAKEK